MGYFQQFWTKRQYESLADFIDENLSAMLDELGLASVNGGSQSFIGIEVQNGKCSLVDLDYSSTGGEKYKILTCPVNDPNIVASVRVLKYNAGTEQYSDVVGKLDFKDVEGTMEVSLKAADGSGGKIALYGDAGFFMDVPDLADGKLLKYDQANVTWKAVSLGESDVPDLSATKITSETFDTARIPDLSATKINSDTLSTDRIPDLAASKVTSGEFDTARIPDLSASKITSGTFDPARVDTLNQPELSSEGYTGVTIELEAAANISAYDMVYVDANGKGVQAQADDTSTMPAIGIAVAAATIGNDVTVLVHGRIRENDWSYTAGAVLYVDDTGTGAPTETQPATSGDQIQRVGVALASDNVLINVSPDVIEVE